MDPLHLRSSGTSLLLAFHTGEAQIVHWGADLGEALPDLALLAAPVPHSALDTPVVGGLLPQASSGWLGRPGLRGQRSEAGVPGFAFSPALRVTSVERDGGDTAVVLQADPEAGVEVRTTITLNRGGLLELSHTLTNTGGTPYQLDELGLVLPVPGDAVELLQSSWHHSPALRRRIAGERAVEAVGQVERMEDGSSGRGWGRRCFNRSGGRFRRVNSSPRFDSLFCDFGLRVATTHERERK